MKNNTTIHVESGIRLLSRALKSKYVLDKFDAVTLHCACTVMTQAYSCVYYPLKIMTTDLLLIHQLKMNHDQWKAITNLLYIIIKKAT